MESSVGLMQSHMMAMAFDSLCPVSLPLGPTPTQHDRTPICIACENNISISSYRSNVCRASHKNNNAFFCTYSVDSCPLGPLGVLFLFQFTLSRRKKKLRTAGWIIAEKSSVAVTQVRSRSSSGALLTIDGSILSHSAQHKHSISVGMGWHTPQSHHQFVFALVLSSDSP